MAEGLKIYGASGEVIRDVYELDTGNAPEKWKALATAASSFTGELAKLAGVAQPTIAEMEKLQAENAKLSSQLENDLTKSFVKAQFAVDALKQGFHILVDFVKGGFTAMFQDERGMNQLNAALKNLGYNVGALGPMFNDLAEELEHTTLVDGNTIRGMEQLMVQFGIAPKAIGPAVRAVLDYAAATGQDARTATMTMLRAVENGKEELSKMGIQIKSTGDASKDLALVTDELTKRYGGTAAQATEGFAGQVGSLSKSLEDLSKAMAAWIERTGVGQTVIKALTEAAKGFTYALSQEHEQEEKAAQRTVALANARAALMDINKRIGDEEGLILKQRMAGEIVTAGYLLPNLREMQAATLRQVKALEAERAAADKATDAESMRAREAENAGRSAGATEIERVRQAENTAKKLKEIHDKEVEEYAADLKKENERVLKHYDELEEFRLARIDNSVDGEIRLEQVRSNLLKKIAQSTYDFRTHLTETELDHARKAAEYRKQAIEAEKKEIESIQATLLNDARNWGLQLVGIALDALREWLTTNQKFSDEYKQASLDRQEADAQEAGLMFDRAAAAQQMADQQDAANKKILASTLASLAQQAAIKAIFEVAEGFATILAPPVSAAHFTAAAIYGGIAIAGGVGAYALTQSRGYTADEQSQLDALKKPSGKSSSGGGSGSGISGSPRATEPGAQVNVYQFGISGWTEAQQMGYLAGIQKKYGSRTMGSGR